MIWSVIACLVIVPLMTTGQSCPAQCTSCDNGIANCLGTGLRNIPQDFPTDTKILDLSSNQLTDLSSRSFPELPSLITLRMSGNGIQEVQQQSFVSLPSLMSLDLSNNPIEHINDEAFTGPTRLRVLSITNAKIKRIGKSLKDVTTLHTLNMVSNEIEELEDDNFATNTDLRMLDLSQNHITKISSKVFANLKYLRYLSLSSNPIVRVPELVFSSEILQLVDFTNCLLEEVPGKMPASVADYRLGNNKLTELKAESFENITNLRLITLNNNDISTVEDKAFGYLEHLMEIWISQNKLRSIPRLLPRNLEKLFLDHNNIYEIGRRNFPINSQLKVLSLDTNKVMRISKDAWGEMPVLKSINLNANKLEMVTSGAFSNIPSLECLKLSNNPIEVIEESAIKDLPSLNELSLSYLNSDSVVLPRDFIGAISNVENINLMNSPTFVKSFLRLMEKSPDAVMDGTKVMSLQYNELESLPTNLRTALPNIAKLFLDGNPWYCDTGLKWLKDWMKSSDIDFYKTEFPLCEEPQELQGREITNLEDSEFVNPREITPDDDDDDESSQISTINQSGLATPTKENKTTDNTISKPKKNKKNKKNKKKKNKKKKNKNRKRKNRKGKKKRDRVKRRQNGSKRKCVIDPNGKKICPGRKRRCQIGPDGKKICKKRRRKNKNKQDSTTPAAVQ